MVAEETKLKIGYPIALILCFISMGSLGYFGTFNGFKKFMELEE